MPAASMSEDFKPSEGWSFTEQCPKLLAIADDFAHECLEKAKAHGFEARTDYMGHKTTISGTMYFRPTDPQSHFSLGCALNNRDNNKIDFLGIYYAAKGTNFSVADTDKAEFRNIDTLNGHVGLIAGGEPMNFVLVRPFITDSIPFSEWNSQMRQDKGKAKNCEPHTMLNKMLHTKRFEKEGKLSIEFCYGSNCDESAFKAYDALPTAAKGSHNIIGDGAFYGPFPYTRFFDAPDHEIIYGNLGFYIESGGSLLMRDNVLKDDCSAFTYFMRGSHYGNLTIPDIAREVCKLPHQP